MDERIEKELEMLSKKFGEIQYGTNGEWVLIKEYNLTTGWNRNKTEIFFAVPAGYPSTKPDNFCVPIGLRTNNGIMPTNYSEPAEYNGKQAGKFSFHVEEWKPSEDIVSGHNLLTFMLGIEKRLQEVN